MADEKHFELLRHGIEVWNAWRLNEPSVRPNLSGIDFGISFAALLGEDRLRALPNIHVSDLDLADFLRVAGLDRPNLEEANLREANLHGANLFMARLRGADLSGADLGGVDLRGADLRGANLYEANLRGANLGAADLAKANLRRADLSGEDLGGANLSEADLSYAKLSKANLVGATLVNADLTYADLTEATLAVADLTKANLFMAFLSKANLIYAKLPEAVLFMASLRQANLYQANLSSASLYKANLEETNLSQTNLRAADLSGAVLRRAILIDTDITDANLTGCHVYGVSAWGLKLSSGTKQQNLIITPEKEPEVTVDNIEVAQFIYLMLNNQNIRGVIDTITSKAVLILGRFTAERKVVLDALREELRKRNYLPILFDFEVPAGGNITETVTLLARMARFIIADLTDPSSIPHELQAIVPHLAKPVQPLLEGASRPYAMFKDYRMYDWVLPVHRYEGLDPLLATLAEKVIAPAEKKVKDLRRRMIEAELNEPQ